MPELEFSDSDEEGFLAPGQEAWRVTTLDARTVPRTVSTQTQYPRWVLPIMADSDSDHEDMPPLLTDSDDNEELPALLPNAAARQRPQAPGPCQCRHSLAGGFAKPGRQG
jgi:hypothetical protein